MKQFLVPGLLLALSLRVAAQTDPPSAAPQPEKAYEMYDLAKPPVFPGGESAMFRFIGEHLEYPAFAKENGISGSVVLSFVVDQDGSLTDIQILKDIGGGCGKAAVKVLESMPRWNPGEAEGRPVKVRYTLPLRFYLQDKTMPSEPQTQAEPEETGPIDASQMWILISETVQKMNNLSILQKSDVFRYEEGTNARLITALELAFRVMTSEADRKGFANFGQVSDYFHKAQYAPAFYSASDFRGRCTKIPSARADFDLNAEGLGKFASLRVPMKAKLILYTKKKFKGKKLVIDGGYEGVDIPDIQTLSIKKPAVKNGAPSFNWGLGTQSLKVIWNR